MSRKEELVKSVKRKLKRPLILNHQAASVAYELFRLVDEFGNEDLEINNLLDQFKIHLTQNALENISILQANYAIKLAGFTGDLEYEEIHKLYSLRDEIYALEYLGFSLPREKKKKLEDNLKSRLSKDRKKAIVAARQNVELWSKGLWWYSEFLA